MNIIEVNGLCKAYGNARPRNYAVFDVSLGIRKGEILGLVGESGCGKSTLGKLLLKLEKPTKGRITFEGTDITDYSFNEMRKIRNNMQIIFQGSSNAFNPFYTVRQIIGEPLNNYCRITNDDMDTKITAMLEKVGLGGEYLGRYSSELSGGQRQRVGIARALVLNPKFVVCDEAISSVDYALKKQILQILYDLKKQNSFTYLFISHDIEAVKAVCDRVVVMYLGNIMEILPHADSKALHPYTKALLAAALTADPAVKSKKKILFKEEGNLEIPGKGCVFQSRCLYAQKQCMSESPGLAEIQDGHYAACHLLQPEL
ncbi:peptide/nickel transport system ATP-binding protein [Sporobacter termitidis DSM 10068]|uniref:Peptide/nickel transport system ATP-binding protein n=1 Tax=Sporobacter termitidis DSM 10068 TaxID=1123282 RepID=A0A1M5WJF1_9FIRM|nr:ABC transporter ATP-binding protein [Sporobacter termitidis]SHH87547.1 peptide/nickel transport system ATP-binding protein [Sporobacter termitidis DSM 10068]